MRQMRTLLLAASAVAMLASCSKSEDSTSPVIDKQIKATSAIEGATTKAVIGTDVALSDLTFLRLDDASADQTTFNFTTATPITGCSRAVGGAITFGTTQTYDKTNNKTAYMRGFTTANATVTAEEKVVWAIDGATDVLLTDVWNAGNYTSPKTEGMAFKHQLSRIEVVCKGKAESDDPSTIWGNVTAIKVVDANPEVTFDYATNAVSATGIAADLPLLKGTYYDVTQPFEAKAILASTAVDEVFGSAMIYPLSTDNNNINIRLKVTTANKGEKTIAIAGITAMDRAKIHKITLTFDAEGKTISATNSTIEEWTDGTPGTGAVPAE